MKNFFTALIFFYAFPFSEFQLYSQSQGYSVQSPAIDGKLTPAEWQGAKVFTRFYKFIPKSDEQNYDSTTVYIKQTKDAIYFGFDYYPKGKIVCKSLTRDRSTEDENEFFIMLDLENKNQNGYFFSFSFINNQRDAIVYNQRNQSSEWDWVWEVKSKIISEPKNGKTGHIQTEVKIPVDKLQNKDKKQIGVDVQMFSYTEDGNYYYYSLIPNSELLSVKNTYKLDLITPFDEKLNLNFDVIPFVVGQSFNEINDTVLFGGDFNVSMDQHKLKATYNTDESTLEADPFRFSLYARPIFLQEKRTFFSKDLDIFRTPINLFYTRAIEEINYGANYTYRSDALKVGAVLVNDTDPYGYKRDFFIARPTYIGQNFNAGALFITSDNPQLGFNEKVFSIDGLYRFPENPLRFQFQVANSVNRLEDNIDEGSAYFLYGYYQYNDAGGPYADVSYKRVNPGFFSTTYFNFQTGLPNNYDEINISGGYKFVNENKYFSDININGGYYRNQIIKKDADFPAGFDLQNSLSMNVNYKVNEWLRFNQYYELNRPNDYNEFGHLIVQNNFAQEYTANFYFGNNFLSAGYYFGSYFGSFINNPYFNGNVLLFDRLYLSASMTFVDVFDTKRTIVNTRMDWKVMNKLFFRTYFQRDNFTKQALWNSMVQYEFFAGSNVYLVVNLNGNNLQYTSRYFKVGYDFSF